MKARACLGITQIPAMEVIIAIPGGRGPSSGAQIVAIVQAAYPYELRLVSAGGEVLVGSAGNPALSGAITRLGGFYKEVTNTTLCNDNQGGSRS
jgi:hypothetical protein